MPALLPIGIRRYQIFQHLLPWLESGKSGTSFYQSIIGTELGIRRSEFFGLVREAKRTVEGGSLLRDLRPSDIPRRRDLPVWAFGSEPTARYRVRYEVRFRDAEGKLQSRFYDLHYTRLHSMKDFLELSAPVAEAYTEQEQGVAEDLRVAYIWRTEP